MCGKLLFRIRLPTGGIISIDNRLQGRRINMLETVSVPILLKAVEFLFDEGRKILEERRERRKAQNTAIEEKTETSPLRNTLPDETTKIEVIKSKEAALAMPIPESAWKESEAKVKHLMALLDIYTKNYYLAKEAYAKWGSALVPPIIIHNLSEAEDGVAKTSYELQSILSKTYGKRIEFDSDVSL
jgi:hypothetical protein